MKTRVKKAAVLFLIFLCAACMAQTALAADKQEKKASQAAQGTAVKASKVTRRLLNKLDLDGYDKLMIVAHPDDESLWGGAHLGKDNYLVVCLTYGENKSRSKQFANAMKVTGDKGIILSHLAEARKQKTREAKWAYCQKAIRRDLKVLLSYKKWDLIVTHNPEGEYGHIGHITTNNVVTVQAKKKGMWDRLYYFGRYYSEKELETVKDSLPQIDKAGKKVAKKLQTVYRKKKSYNVFVHMTPYENWIKASEWKP